MKNAKKSMFITTILMVAVLIVAVSTATFAWYTTTTGVNATNAVVSSASSTSADIGIDWTNDLTTTSTSIDLGNGSPILPMVPTAEVAVGAESIAFNTAPVDLAGNFVKTGVESATAWTTTSSFFVINKNYNEPANVTMKATFGAGTGEGAANLSANLCVAVFAKATDATGSAKLIGVFATKDYKVGNISEDDIIKNADLANCTEWDDLSAGIALPVINARQAVEITVYAWINGDDLASANAGKSVATFSFTFGA